MHYVMEYHRISFIHNDTEYSFIKAMNDRLVGYALMSACRLEVQIYMKENTWILKKLKSNQIFAMPVRMYLPLRLFSFI